MSDFIEEYKIRSYNHVSIQHDNRMCKEEEIKNLKIEDMEMRSLDREIKTNTIKIQRQRNT